MSLFRTYDVTWPDQTQQNLSWADTFNVGLSVAAPGCWISHYNFYVFYLIQMALPVSPLANLQTGCILLNLCHLDVAFWCAALALA